MQAALEAGKAVKRREAERQLKRTAAMFMVKGGAGAPAGFPMDMSISNGLRGHDGQRLDAAQMYAVERMQARHHPDLPRLH